MASFFGGRRGERRKFQDNLNLVPFIDLFTALTIFLITTAVWDQLASLPASLGQQAGGDEAVDVPKELVKDVKASVKITVTKDFIELFDEGKASRIPIDSNAFNLTPLAAFITGVRQKFPDKSDIVIFASDEARYENIITVMDQCLAKNFADLIVTGMPSASASTPGSTGKGGG